MVVRELSLAYAKAQPAASQAPRMLALLDRALRWAGFRPLYGTDVWGIHVLIFARRA